MTSEVMASILERRHPEAMLENITKAMLLIVAVIHLLPVFGFFGTSALANLYGIKIDSPDLEVLMRHRSALFAYAAFHPPTRPLAFVAAAASLAAFFYLAATVPDTTPAIRKIALADAVATTALTAAFLGDRLPL